MKLFSFLLTLLFLTSCSTKADHAVDNQHV